MRLSPGILILVIAMGACDTVRPDRPGTLVLEAYVESGRPLPPVRISRTTGLHQTAPRPEPGASVLLTIDDRAVPYEHAVEFGVYRPAAGHDTIRARPGDVFRLNVMAGGDQAVADGRVPPPIDGVWTSVTVPAQPVEAVLLDSLSLPLDSLQFELPSRTGYVYPIVASVSWPESQAGWWVAVRLEPRLPFSSTLLDFFLRPFAVDREENMDPGQAGDRTWSGVYAVPVEDDTADVPEHDLVITVVRGDQDWALFSASSGDPDRREPVSNVTGGVGIVAGISVVRITVQIP